MSAEPSLASTDARFRRWSLITAVNDVGVLRGTLLSSPCVDGDCEVITKEGYSSAGAAYNEGVVEATNDLVVFAHTDVYFPADWIQSVRSALKALDAIDPNWGILGVCGRALDGSIAGHVYSTGSTTIFGRPFSAPVETVSLDEMVLIARKSSQLRFNPDLGFHFYGTDICYEAKRRGMKSYVIPAFCIHNSNGISVLPWSFWRSYMQFRRKWWLELPVTTCCTVVTRDCRAVLAGAVAWVREQVKSSSAVGSRTANPHQLYLELKQRVDH